MRSSTATLLALAGAAVALPTPEADPIRILPKDSNFTLTSLRGPGCPQKKDGSFDTRFTYGMNTMDGSEIYYWHVAYPFLKASVDAKNTDAHVWCETTIAYAEYDGSESHKPTADYRLRLHKNGTRILSTYDLDEGVTATWKFTCYLEDDDEVVDTITYKGPYKKLPYEETMNSPVTAATKPRPFSECGKATIKYRTDLYLTSAMDGAKGTVQGEALVKDEAGVHNYGVQQGFSYDWQKCAKK